MAYIYDEPLNNRSGIGGKERMEREEAKGAMERQEEREESREAKVVEREREADKAVAEAEKKELEG